VRQARKQLQNEKENEDNKAQHCHGLLSLAEGNS
jgi:hypothetical protein